MKTKLIILTAFIILCSISVIKAQDVDKRLLVKYEKSYLEQMRNTNPGEYDFLVYFVNKACDITDMPNKRIDYIDLKRVDSKTGKESSNHRIKLSDLDNINPLEYNIELQYSMPSYYKAGETGKLIIVPSREEMNFSVANERRIRKLNLKQ